MLSRKDLKTVVQFAHLTAIDILVSYQNKILLGKRINNPAKGWLFVPGGIVQKHETYCDAFKRLSMKEFNIDLDYNRIKPNMISQHRYDNNFEDDTFGTVYNVVGVNYELTDDEYAHINIDDQHEMMIWLTKEELLEREDVHYYCKRYFDPNCKDNDSVMRF